MTDAQKDATARKESDALKDRFVVTFNSDGQPKVLMRASEASRLLNDAYPADKGWAMNTTISKADFDLPATNGLGVARPATLIRIDLVDPTGRIVRTAHKAAAITAVHELEAIETILLTRLAARCGFVTESLDEEQVAAVLKAGGQVHDDPAKPPAEQTNAPKKLDAAGSSGSNVVELSTAARQQGAGAQPAATQGEGGSTSAGAKTDSRPRVAKSIEGAPKAQQLNQIQGYARKLGRSIEPPPTAEEAATLIESLRKEWHDHARN